MLKPEQRATAVTLAFVIALAPAIAAAEPAPAEPAPAEPAPAERDAAPVETDESPPAPENETPAPESEAETPPAPESGSPPAPESGSPPAPEVDSPPAPESEPPPSAIPPQTPEPPPSPVEADAFESAGLAGTRVELVGGAPGELELFRFDPEAGERSAGSFQGVPYVRVCASPCETPVQIGGGEYFVAGAKVMPSRPFSLDEHAYRPAVRLHVRPGPRAIRFAGFGLVVSGAILAPGGGLLVGAVDRKPADIAGYVLIGTGVAALAAGIALVIRGRTLVHVPER